MASDCGCPWPYALFRSHSIVLYVKGPYFTAAQCIIDLVILTNDVSVVPLNGRLSFVSCVERVDVVTKITNDYLLLAYLGLFWPCYTNVPMSSLVLKSS